MSDARDYPFPEPQPNEMAWQSKVEPAPKVSLRHSPTIGNLAAALAKAQLSFVPIVKGIENTFYYNEKTKKKAMYADLAAIISATQKSLAENELVIIQTPIIRHDLKCAGVTSIMVHSSGEWMSNEIILPATAKTKIYDGPSFTWGEKFDAQTCGIAITYSRRYSYQSLVGVAAEEDDDANSISEPGTTGSQHAANIVAARKIAESKARNAVGSLFYSWSDAEQKGYVTGDQELLTANKELLLYKGKYSKADNAIVVDADGLEELKFELGERNVPFVLLKSPDDLTGKLKASIAAVAAKKKL